MELLEYEQFIQGKWFTTSHADMGYAFDHCAGAYSLYCAVIVKRVDEKTRSKVGINELLRDI